MNPWLSTLLIPQRGQPIPGQGAPLSESAGLSRKLTPVAPATRVAKRVTTHPPRHSFATHLPERKVDIRVIPGAGRL